MSRNGIIRRHALEKRALDLGWALEKGTHQTEFGRDGYRIRACWSDNRITTTLAVFAPDGRMIESSNFLMDRWVVQSALWERLEHPAGPDAPPDGAALASDVLAYADLLRTKAPDGLFGLLSVADRLCEIVQEARR